MVSVTMVVMVPSFPFVPWAVTVRIVVKELSMAYVSATALDLGAMATVTTAARGLSSRYVPLATTALTVAHEPCCHLRHQCHRHLRRHRPLCRPSRFIRHATTTAANASLLPATVSVTTVVMARSILFVPWAVIVRIVVNVLHLVYVSATALALGAMATVTMAARGQSSRYVPLATTALTVGLV